MAEKAGGILRKIRRAGYFFTTRKPPPSSVRHRGRVFEVFSHTINLDINSCIGIFAVKGVILGNGTLWNLKNAEKVGKFGRMAGILLLRASEPTYARRFSAQRRGSAL